MKKLGLTIKLHGDTPQALAELLRNMATQVERRIYPVGLDWGSLLGFDFAVDQDTDYGVAKGKFRLRSAPPDDLSYVLDFAPGDIPLMPWDQEGPKVSMVSITREHKVKEVSTDPHKDAWFLFVWEHWIGYHVPHSAYATDGNSWLAFTFMNNSSNDLEVTYEVPMSKHLTEGDRDKMHDHIEDFVSKMLKD